MSTKADRPSADVMHLAARKLRYEAGWCGTESRAAQLRSVAAWIDAEAEIEAPREAAEQIRQIAERVFMTRPERERREVLDRLRGYPFPAIGYVPYAAELWMLAHPESDNEAVSHAVEALARGLPDPLEWERKVSNG